jgi:putative proton-coupled thiamine transporter YuaJ
LKVLVLQGVIHLLLAEMEIKMKKFNTWMLTEAGICIAFFIVLKQIKIFEMPMGGSITAGAMVPLFVFAFRWGGKKGILIGIVAGILDFILGTKYSFHPVSLLFDYPIAYGMLGIAGFFGKKTVGMLAGAFIGVFGRFACHVLSGVVVFASYTPKGQHPLVYSILYNGTFLLPEFIISFILVTVIIKYARLPQPKTV